MAEEIAKLVLKNKQIKDISLKVEKPGALRGSKSVGVNIFRKQ
jgi:dihydroneopterin aldolase